MLEPKSDASVNVRSLIWMPALVTFGITLLRLVGELAHWSPLFFNRGAGGGAAIVGISWLPFVFGPYFAIKLARLGQGGAVWKTVGLAVLGMVIMVAGMFLLFAPQVKFPGKMILGILLIVLGPSLVTLGWPALFKLLVAYGYAARIPVAVLMFFALRGHWGTHYDALPPNVSLPASFFGRYMYLAFVPQMVMWVAFTVLVGALVGAIASALVVHSKTSPAAV